jgi:hypothetical protein
MSSVRILKKEIRYVIGDIIDAIYVTEMTTTGKPSDKSSALLMESISAYDEFMARINQKPTESAKSHFKAVRNDFEKTVYQLVEKVNALN